MSGTTTYEEAKRSREWGAHQFALPGRTKVANGTPFPRLATRDPAQLDRWFNGTDNNAGVFTGKYGDADEALLVLDVDMKNGVRGWDTIEEFEKIHGTLPDTRQHGTPTGGAHLIYKVPHPVGQKPLGKGVDVRSRNGYIVGPGSQTEAGVYTVELDIPIADAPQWLFDLQKAHETPAAPQEPAPNQDNEAAIARGVRYLTTTAPEAIEGAGGDATTYKVACLLKDFGISRQGALPLMLEHYNPRCRPAWGVEELAAKVAHAYKYGIEPPGVADPSRAFKPVPVIASVPLEPLPDIPAPHNSDDACALDVANAHADRLRYVSKWGVWLILDKSHWRQDDTVQIFDIVRKEQRKTARACNELTTAKNLSSAKTVAAVTTLLKSDRRIAATTEQWDANEWRLGTPDGVVDLTTGIIRPAVAEDYITKITTISPAGAAPLWTKFINRVTGGDVDLERYLQKLAGYSLTGSTREQAIFFLYGTGGNGKGVFLNTLSAIMGEYAATASIGTFTAAAHERHSTDMAMLRGARLVTAQETEAGRRWDEAKIKALTGGDPITARFMRQDFFTFLPQFSLVIAGNHKPGLRHVDESIRRRMHLIPFTVTIPTAERDEKLPQKLRAEWPGILAWAIQGCLLWQQEGLERPPAVRRATDEYLADEDTLGRWLAECCDIAPNLATRSTALYEQWKQWAERGREYAGTQKAFSTEMKNRGYAIDQDRQGSFYRGVTQKARFEMANKEADCDPFAP